MSTTPDAWDRAATAREDWQRADGALNRLRTVHSTLSSLHDAVRRHAPAPETVTAARTAVDRLGRGEPAALSFCTDPVLPEDRTLEAAFQHGRAVTPAAAAVASALTDYAAGGEWAPVRDGLGDIIEPEDGPMAIDTTTLDQLVTLFGLAVEAGIRYREAREDALQSALADAYDGLDEPLPALEDQPLALLPVRLETRFVDANGQTDDRPRELLVRVYPDQIHTDSHEAELTDEEVVWGQNFWATLWYARHPDPAVVPDDPAASYLTRLPTQRLRERVAGIDPAGFSDDHAARYAELRERAWQQLLDRFGRERAGYVAHALEPTDDDLATDLLTKPRTMQSLLRRQTDGGEDDVSDDLDLSEDDDAVSLADDDDSTVVGGDRSVVGDQGADFSEVDLQAEEGLAGTVDISDEAERADILAPEVDPTPDLPTELPELAFPTVPRRPGSWTKQPRAKLLPDRWIAVAEWETPSGTPKRTAIAGDPIREPLPTGPSPESVAGDELDDDGTESGFTPDGMAWMADFEAAADVGMALRLPVTGLAGFDPGRGFERVSVLGVKASLDDQATPDALVDLLDAHHYTDGLSVLLQGTPTNNHDESAGAADDPVPGVTVECVPSLVDDGDRSDGDLLARALSIGPDEDESHVFAHVANADGTEQRDARHMNSALWPATLGYSLAHIFLDNDVAGNPSLWNGSAAGGLGGPTRDTVEGHLLWLDAYRRHFIRYVRGRGPFPTLRVGDQPYGVLPATAIETERDLSLLDPQLVADLGRGQLDLGGLDGRGGSVELLVQNGMEPRMLIDAGASPDAVVRAGADPKRLVSGGVDPETALDATGLAPAGVLQDGIGHLATSRLTSDRLERAGIPPDDLAAAGITTRSLARGEVTDEQLQELGVSTEALAEVVLPEQAKTLGLTPTALERAGVTPAMILNGEFTAEQVEALGLDTRAVADAVLPDAVRELGITPKTIEDAGISPTDLLNGQVSLDQLDAAGVTTEALAEALLPQAVVDFGVTPTAIAEAGITPEQLFNADVSLEQLEAAGLSTANFADAVLPQSFRDAGITPQSLEAGGITPDAVLNGAVTPDDLIEAGITPSTLADAGVLPDALADVGQTIGDLLDAGLEPSVLLDRGLTPQSLLDAGVTPDLLVDAGLAPKRLVDAGVDVVELATTGAAPVEDLLRAGASPAELARAGATVADLAGGDVPVEELVQTGMTAIDLLSAGADALGAAKGGARPSHLREANVDAGTLRSAGKAAGSLRVAGYSVEELLDAGYTAVELLNGGYTPEELTAAGVSPDAARSGGRDVSTMLAAGHTPAELRAAGHAAEHLQEAGLDASALVDAGYTAGELADAGLQTEELVAGGLDAGSLRAADVDVSSLLDAGVEVSTLRERGATAAELLEAGQDPESLLDAGFASVELSVAGVDVDGLAEDAVEGDLETDDVVDAAVEGLQYAATVLESPDRAEREAYAFSFDPAVPTLTDGERRGAAGPEQADDAGETDGGVATAGVPIVRPLSIDDRLRGRLRNEVSGFGGVWDAAASGLPFGGALDEDGLLNALKREAVATDVRQRTMVYSGEPSAQSSDAVAAAVDGYFLPSQQHAIKEILEAGELTDLDPRVAYLYPTDATQDEAVDDMRRRDLDGGLRDFYTNHLSQATYGIIDPHETVDGDIGLFIDVLLGAPVSAVHDLGDVVNPLTFSLDTSMLGLEKEAWYELDRTEQRRRMVEAIEDADDPAAFARRLANHDPTGHEQGYSKLLALGDNQADFGDSGVLRSLLRILLQHGLLHAYLGARRRLGAAYDDLPSPLVDPAVAPEADPTMMDTLWDPAPDALRAHPDVDDEAETIYYQQTLTAAAANYSTTTSIDPRLSEFADSLRYLRGVDPDSLATLTHETLDLASHRLDAWWTSLATKELFELREAQGTVDPDGGVDQDAWEGAASDVARATLDPALVSSMVTDDDAAGTSTIDTGAGGESPTVAEATSGDGASRAFDPAALGSLDLSAGGDGDGSTDGGVDPVGTAADAGDGDSGGDGTIDLSGLDIDGIATRGTTIERTAIDDRAATDPGLYVGGYGFVENLSADPAGAEPEYIHAPSEQHASTAAILHSGAEAHDADEGENVLAMDLSAARIRAGLRILRGVRRGQSLGELLGYRFERRMHEATLDPAQPDLMQYADVFRAEYPQRLDKLERPDASRDASADEQRDELAARDALDGLALLRNWADYPWGRGETLPDADSDAHETLSAIVAELQDDIDAVGDMLTAESVHQLGQGNYERAGGSIDALARGAQLPDPEVIQTPRTETGFSHRQFLLFGDEPATAETPRARAAPSLAAWVETLLPDHTDVECTAMYRWSETRTDPATETEETVEHSEPTWLSLADLSLGPLDVLLLFGTSREETRSELEQRIVYHLIRQRPSEPPVPADATVELELTATQHEGAVSMADLLELGRSVRELVQTARPATAADLAHPADAADEGYDEATATTLTERANDAQDRLYAAATAIDERLALLDAGHRVGDGLGGIPTPTSSSTASDGGTPSETSWDHLGSGVHLPTSGSPALEMALLAPSAPLTTQVDDLVAAVEAVDAEVPFATVETAARGVDAGSIRSELSTLVGALPAGPTARETATEDHLVAAAAGQSITGRLGERVTVPDVGGEESPADETGGDGAADDGDAAGSSPTTWSLAPQATEAGIMGVSTTETGTVLMDDASEVEDTDASWYADALESVDVGYGTFDQPGFDVGGGESGGSATDDEDAATSPSDDTDSEAEETATDWSTATATVRAWGTDGLDWFETETTTTPDAAGRFDVAVDFSGVAPGTAFQVVALVDGTVVYSATGRVVAEASQTADAQSTFRADCGTLQRLRWLRARQSLLSASEGPSARLIDAHGGVTDWDALADERDAVHPATSTVTSDQLAAIDRLLTLESFDPTALTDSADAAVGPVAKLGLDKIVDVTAGDGPDDPDGVTYWLGATGAIGSVRARIDRTLDNPALYNDGAAPWLLKYDHGSARRLHDLDDGATAASYLDAFLAQPGWTVRYLDRKLADPTALVRDLAAWLYTPADVDRPGDLATALQDLAAEVGDLPALEALFEGLPTGDAATRRDAFAAHLRAVAGAIGTSPPSLPAASAAVSTFDAAAASATSELASAAQAERDEIHAISAGLPVDRAVRTVVLEQLRDPMTVAASYGVYGGTPETPDGDTPEAEAALLEQARALLGRLRTRLQDAAALDPRIDGTLAGQPVPQRVETQTDRLTGLFGDGFTVLPPFEPSNPAELTATFTDAGLVPDEHGMAPETWLQRAARVREHVDSFREARSYAEALSGTLTPSLTIGQVPFEPGDTWIGIDGVAPEPGRISLIAQFGPGASPATADGRLTGLYVDEWTETVPADSETTGLALNYDDPGNRAPQSILLVPPPSEGWSLDHLAATIAETTTYMERRAVDLGDLPADATHLFPALTFAQQAGPNRTTPSVTFGMLDWYDRELVAPLLPAGELLYTGVGGDSDE